MLDQAGWSVQDSQAVNLYANEEWLSASPSEGGIIDEKPLADCFFIIHKSFFLILNCSFDLAPEDLWQRGSFPQ
jgi:hypothetical protein